MPIQPTRENHEMMGALRTRLLSDLNRHMRAYGYRLIDLPIIDLADLFLVKAGDQVINSLFTFDRQGRQLALRPEFTASAASYFAETQGDSIARWQFAGPIFEDKSYQSSDEFEQLGIGAELIGLGGSLAEAEIIAMSAKGLEEIDVHNTRITIGHIGLIRELIRPFNLDSRTQRFLLHSIPAFSDALRGVKWVIDQFDNQFASIKARGTNAPELYEHLGMTSETRRAMGGRTQEDILRRLKLKQQRFTERDTVIMAIKHLEMWCQMSGEPSSTFEQMVKLIPDTDEATKLLGEWREVITLLEAHDVPSSQITIKADLARSWDYYTGIVFELHSDGIHLGGGGRYDELARLMGSKVDTPSVGFTYYGNQLINALAQNSDHHNSEAIFVIEADEQNLTSAVLWANQLRKRGLPVEICPQSTNEKTESKPIKAIDANTVQFQASQYQTDQIDTLINQLKQSS